MAVTISDVAKLAGGKRLHRCVREVDEDGSHNQ